MGELVKSDGRVSALYVQELSPASSLVIAGSIPAAKTNFMAIDSPGRED